MVTVPGSKARSVAVTPAQAVFQNSSVPSGAFRVDSSGLGEGLSSFGASMRQIANQMLEEDNETKAKAADNRISESIRRITRGDPDDPSAPPGYLTLRGEKALGSFGAAEEALRAAVSAELDGVKGNPALTGMINSHVGRRLQGTLDRMTEHASEQRLAVQEGVSAARKAQAFKDAVGDYSNPTAIKEGVGITDAETLDEAERNGITDQAVIDTMLEANRGVIVMGAFDAAMAQQDVERGQAIFAQYGDKIDGATRTKMAKTMVADVMAVTSQRVAAEARRLHGRDPAAARAYIESVTTGKTQDASMDAYQRHVEMSRGDTRFAISLREAQRAEESAAYTRETRELPVMTQRAVDSIEEAVGPNATYAEKREAAEATYDGRMRDSVLEEIDRQQAREERDKDVKRGDAAAAAEIASRARAKYNFDKALDLEAERNSIKKASQDYYNYLNAPRTPGEERSMEHFRVLNNESYQVLAGTKEMVPMTELAIRLQTGQKFRTESDNVTYSGFLKQSISERAADNATNYLGRATEDEYRKIESAIGAAVASTSGPSAALFRHGRESINRYLPEGLKGQARIDISNAIYDRLSSEVNASVESKKPLSLREVEQLAAKLATRIEADSSWGDGISDAPKTFVALAIAGKTMNAAQRNIATVDFEEIPAPILAAMHELIDAEGIPRGMLTERASEQLAAAVALRDTDRVDRIIATLKGLAGGQRR